MGQYYKPINIAKKQYLLSHEYDSGLKLMEHSYLGNGFVGTVEALLIPGGAWHKDPIVWAGDYADAEEGTITEENKSGENLWSLIGHDDANKIQPKNKLDGYFIWSYLVNHTKKQYVNYQRILEGTPEEPFEESWSINPLPLLTCEGNGRGGGDFHGEDERIGTWARDSISIEEFAPEGYEEINGLFIEN